MTDAFTALKISDTHEWRLDNRRWWLHYLPSDDGQPLRPASRFEAELLNAAKREIDAALGVTVIQQGCSWCRSPRAAVEVKR